MSKSYNNTIPLFEGGSKAMRAAIMRIVTDSREPGEPKDAENSHLYTIYRAFASAEQAAAFRRQLEEGMGWGDAKNALYEHLEALVAPMRDRYVELMADPARIEDILQAGAAKARKLATPLMRELREAVGLRNISAAPAAAPRAGKKEKAKGARFVSFRETDGSFRFRLLAADGEELLLSGRHADPKAAGAALRRLQTEAADLRAGEDGTVAAYLDGSAAASMAVADAEAHLEKIRAALASLAEE
jgi:tryptophanyl-tRNA synthetase